MINLAWVIPLSSDSIGLDTRRGITFSSVPLLDDVGPYQRVKYSAKRWRLGCVIPHPGSLWLQGELMQPIIHLLAELSCSNLHRCPRIHQYEIRPLWQQSLDHSERQDAFVHDDTWKMMLKGRRVYGANAWEASTMLGLKECSFKANPKFSSGLLPWELPRFSLRPQEWRIN